MAPRVLIVDDDPAIRLVTKRLLKMLKCDPFEARDGIEGEKIALQIQPDLILLDIMMPLQDGYETCQRLRERGFGGPIILFSALLRENERGRAQAVGATSYIQKPITKEELSHYLDGAILQ
jgi:two-component system response regulator RpaA